MFFAVGVEIEIGVAVRFGGSFRGGCGCGLGGSRFGRAAPALRGGAAPCTEGAWDAAGLEAAADAEALGTALAATGSTTACAGGKAAGALGRFSGGASTARAALGSEAAPCGAFLSTRAKTAAAVASATARPTMVFLPPPERDAVCPHEAMVPEASGAGGLD